MIRLSAANCSLHRLLPRLAQQQPVEIHLAEGLIGGDRLNQIILPGHRTASVIANSDCADGKIERIHLLLHAVADTSSSHFDSPPSCHVGRSLRISDRAHHDSANVVATSPTSDMLVSVFVPVTRRRAVVPATLRSSASASICGAPVGLRGAVSLIAHPSLFATYGRSHACTVSSTSELEKYCICIVSILRLARVQRRRRLRIAHNLRARRFTSSPIVARPAV